jgi:hypothetical protein
MAVNFANIFSGNSISIENSHSFAILKIIIKSFKKI